MKLGTCTALVTGGAVRIGRAICEALAERKCRIVIHCRNSASEAEALACDLCSSGAEAFVVKADLSEDGSCERLMNLATEKVGPVEVLINNASVFSQTPLLSATQDAIDEQFRVNLLAPMALTKAFAAQTARGKIINLLDQSIARDVAELTPYLLSKKALAEATVIAARELGPGITVNGVAPGPVLPPPGTRKDEPVAAGDIILDRVPEPRDIADAVMFLLEADAITGQVIYVDSGQHLLG